MRVLEVIGGTLVLALLLLLGFLGWQTAANSSATKDKVDELNKNVTKLLDEMHKAPDGSVSQKESVTQKDLDEARAKVVAADLRAANQRLALAERLAKVEKDQKANLEVVNEQRTTLGQIATKDAAGNSIVVLSEGALKNPQFTQAVDEAVRKATRKLSPPIPPQWATLRIENKTPSWQDLEVNSVSHRVDPLSHSDISVRPGSVTTRLTGYEDAKTWPIEAPDYFRTVIIELRTR